MKKTMIGATALLLATALSACGGDSSDGDETSGGGETPSGGEASDGGGEGSDMTTIRVANLPVVSTMVINIAQEQGFLTDHGVEAEVTESFELGTFIPALGNQYDIVMATPSDFLVAATRGFDIMVASGGWADGPSVISAEASTIEDLEGTTIATNSLTGLQYAMLSDVLETNGVDAELSQVPFAAQPDQLKAGEVDAVTVPEPWASSLLAEDEYQRVFIPVDDATGVTGQLTGWYSVTEEFASANPEAVQGFADAIVDAIEWIRGNEAEFRQFLQDELELDAETANSIEMPGYYTEITADDLEVFLDPLIRQEQLDSSAEELNLDDFVLGS